MNRELVERWNGAVAPGDLVYILGDMFWCGDYEAASVLSQLNGTKILVKGNHDRVHSGNIQKMFAKITNYLGIKDNDRGVVLCHYPIPCFKNHFYGWYHLYGHVHNSFEYNMMEHVKQEMAALYDKPCQMFNVGVMMPWMDYTPRTLDEILSANGLDGGEADG